MSVDSSAIPKPGQWYTNRFHVVEADLGELPLRVGKTQLRQRIGTGRTKTLFMIGLEYFLRELVGMLPAILWVGIWDYPIPQVLRCSPRTNFQLRMGDWQANDFPTSICWGGMAMATCPSCNQWFIGGVKAHGQKFCSEGCAEQGVVLQVMDMIPAHLLDEQVARVHTGLCPVCKGPGPVEYFETHNVYAFLVMTRWTSTPHVCCKGCASQKALNAIALTLVTGWWGIPHGLVTTPIQIARNIGTMRRQVVTGQPSTQMRSVVGKMLAVEYAERQAAQQPKSLQPPPGPRPGGPIIG